MTTPPPLRTGVPPAEIDIDGSLVKRLLADQHPDLADLPIRELDAGWDNVMFRLGDELIVRVPRRALGGELIERELWGLPQVAGNLPIPVPVPIRSGRPTDYYPWSWSILPWIEGEPVLSRKIAASEAESLARFLRELHRPAPERAAANPFRGVPLSMRDEMIQTRMNSPLVVDEIGDDIRSIWKAGVEAELYEGRLWLHGDLHPKNVLVRDEKIAGIIDWGDITAGDPATDLAALWMLFEDPDLRIDAMRTYCNDTDPPAPLLLRSRAWSALFGITMLDAGAVNEPALADLGRVILSRTAAG